MSRHRSIQGQRICYPYSTLEKVDLINPLSTYKPAETLLEIATRIALLYCAQILATGFSGLIAAGIFAGMDGLKGIAGWRWLFIV
jgi:hypothetical protein